MNKVNINIELPNTIYKSLILFHTEKNSNEFIVDAIKQSLDIENQKKLKLLAEGYKNLKNEDNNLMKDFEISDFENIE